MGHQAPTLAPLDYKYHQYCSALQMLDPRLALYLLPGSVMLRMPDPSVIAGVI